MNGLGDLPKFGKCVVNSNAAISAKNRIASNLTSLSKEPFIQAHLLFLKGYHELFWNKHFIWMETKDNITKMSCFKGHHMVVHYCAMQNKFENIKVNWKTKNEYKIFLDYAAKSLNEVEKKAYGENVAVTFFNWFQNVGEAF